MPKHLPIASAQPDGWTVVFSPEVEKWHDSLVGQDKEDADAAITDLKEEGNNLQMPDSRSLKQSLFELRFHLSGSRVDQRITYTFEPAKRIITLTTFHKSRNNEKKQIARARKAQAKLKVVSTEDWKTI
jgi:hypothetical protein